MPGTCGPCYGTSAQSFLVANPPKLGVYVLVGEQTLLRCLGTVDCCWKYCLALLWEQALGLEVGCTAPGFLGTAGPCDGVL